MENYDFSGWATKANLKCSDGRVIMKDAFKAQHGRRVPLVWMHQHNNLENVLGHAILENREEGVYAYCFLNDSEYGKMAKAVVKHGDVVGLSIWANQLKQNGSSVLHGAIREVSLVLAGANPGAYIDSIIMHGEESEEEAVMFVVEDTSLAHSKEQASEEEETLEHADESSKEKEGETKSMAEETKKPESSEKTVQEVWDSFTEEQKTVAYAMIGQALEDQAKGDGEDDNKEGEETVKHNVFDKETQTNTLSHADMAKIITDAKRNGSLKDTIMHSDVAEQFLAHDGVTDEKGNQVTYGIANVDYLFPDARLLNSKPDFISRDMAWVGKIMHGAKHTPFSRIKSMHANITMDEARARGYTKGKRKVEEVFALLKRVTGPTTIYKKQKMDRDDIIDITDFDVIVWLKAEMRMMLDEEIARAALIGDGRVPGTDDKISEDCIRPIYKDDPLYTVRKHYTPSQDATSDERAKAFIRTVIKSRKEYKGSGNPALYTTEDVVTDCLLLEDANGRVIYDTVEKLKTALRVSDIVTVPVMEGITREGEGSDTNVYSLMGILVNMADYTFGADKGGEVNMFDDFDIDFNQQKYLIETRCSGALTKPASAIVIEEAAAASSVSA